MNNISRLAKKTTKHLIFDRSEKIMEYNKLIDYFIHGATYLTFRDSTYWLSVEYNSSFDALMPAIRKIKKIIFEKPSFTPFSNEAIYYDRIGCALYDADIEMAFYSVGRFLTYHYHFEKVQDIIKALSNARTREVVRAIESTNPFQNTSEPLSFGLLVRNQIQQISTRKYKYLPTNEILEANYDVIYKHQLQNLFWNAKKMKLEP